MAGQNGARFRPIHEQQACMRAFQMPGEGSRFTHRALATSLAVRAESVDTSGNGGWHIEHCHAGYDFSGTPVRGMIARIAHCKPCHDSKPGPLQAKGEDESVPPVTLPHS